MSFNTTFYGILISNLVFNPFAVKLATRTHNETHLISVLHAGVLGIKRKAHYLIVTEQMNTFLSQGDQDSIERKRRGLLNFKPVFV